MCRRYCPNGPPWYCPETQLEWGGMGDYNCNFLSGLQTADYARHSVNGKRRSLAQIRVQAVRAIQYREALQTLEKAQRPSHGRPSGLSHMRERHALRRSPRRAPPV